ncbi:MAG: polysaccharide deacetylase family protein [Anaerolineales bacterium]|nr:polysaccharide deacetylase family protein [Anaerolineales bacterium]
MKPNPVMQKLGLSDDDRLVIIHTDDIGMCQASVAAFAELWEFGLISSGATMVPCSWFLEAAKLCQENPEIDMGVHLTLTSEWETYRWSPISTRDPKSGMVDEQGFFFHSTEQAQEHGEAEAVQIEIQAQIDRAIANGIKPTHIDTHMGSIASPKYIPAYLQMAIQYKLPPMIMRLTKEEWLEMDMSPELAAMAVQMVASLEEQGVPLLDRIAGLELNRVDTPAERVEYAKHVLGELGPGITHFIIHPSKHTPELCAITPDWPYRVADFEAFRSEDLSNFVTNSGLHVIGYRTLLELMHVN